MVLSPSGLGTEIGCAGEDQQELETTDPFFRQRGRHTQQTRNCLTVKKSGLEPQMGLDTVTGRPTINHDITLTLTFKS
jgi:hypothetical protein